MPRAVLTTAFSALLLMAAGGLVAGLVMAAHPAPASGPQVGADLGELRAITFQYASLSGQDADAGDRALVADEFRRHLEALRPTLVTLLGTDAHADAIEEEFQRYVGVADDGAAGRTAARDAVISAVNQAIADVESEATGSAARNRMWVTGLLAVLVASLGAVSLYLLRVRRLEQGATRELGEATARLRGILDSAQNGIVIVDQDGVVRFANPAFGRLVGIPVSDLVGSSVAMFVDPDELIRVSEIGLARLQGKPAPNRYLRTLTHASGRAVDVDSMATVIDFDGERMVLVEHRDVSGEVRARRAAEESAARLDAIFDAVPDVIWVADPQGTLTHVNRTVTDLLGWSEDDLRGRSVELLFAASDGSAHLDWYPRAWGGGDGEPIFERTVTARAADGREILVDLRMAETTAGDTRYLIGVMRDARTRLAAEQDHLLAQRAVVRSDFLATMSHELRTPLHAITGFAEVLGDEVGGPLTPRQREYVTHIEEASALLLSLIEDVLDMARIDAGKHRLVAEPFAPAVVLDRATETVRRPAEAKGLELVVHTREAPETWTGDERAFMQVALNLLSNAVKFTSRGRVEVHLSGETPLVLRVTDTGAGITARDIERIFEPFEQAAPRRSLLPGTGLGLAIVRRLAELHGGSVSVQSQPGAGSVFTVRLPPLTVADAAGGGPSTPPVVRGS